MKNNTVPEAGIGMKHCGREREVKSDEMRHVLVEKTDGGVTIDVPRQFTADGIVHAVILTMGVVILGAVIHTEADLSRILPPPLNAHANLLLWAILLGGYAIFVLLCLMGVGSSVLWRLGELGQRGSFVALTMYSVHVAVSPFNVEITERWFLRRRTRRISTSQIISIKQEESGLTIATSSGHTNTYWFSLYPPTVKRIKYEIEQAITYIGGVKA